MLFFVFTSKVHQYVPWWLFWFPSSSPNWYAVLLILHFSGDFNLINVDLRRAHTTSPPFRHADPPLTIDSSFSGFDNVPLTSSPLSRHSCTYGQTSPSPQSSNSFGGFSPDISPIEKQEMDSPPPEKEPPPYLFSPTAVRPLVPQDVIPPMSLPDTPASFSRQGSPFRKPLSDPIQELIIAPLDGTAFSQPISPVSLSDSSIPSGLSSESLDFGESPTLDSASDLDTKTVSFSGLPSNSFALSPDTPENHPNTNSQVSFLCLEQSFFIFQYEFLEKSQ